MGVTFRISVESTVKLAIVYAVNTLSPVPVLPHLAKEILKK